ncbi:MAG: GNAT family N-acetyltransferase [bacterium]|nr:GNAT family N-acetyltransferase [bacterium]
MKIEEAKISDAGEILALQKLAYQSEAKIINDFTIPPLTQTREELEKEYDYSVVLAARQDDRIVGSVRAHCENGTCYIGKLIVDPAEQKKGIGARLMREIENRFVEAERYELFTGEKSENNIRFYRNRGYRLFRTEKINEKLSFVFFEKSPHYSCGDC